MLHLEFNELLRAKFHRESDFVGDTLEVAAEK